MTLWQWAVVGCIFGHVWQAADTLVNKPRIVRVGAAVVWWLFHIAAFTFYGWLWSKGAR